MERSLSVLGMFAGCASMKRPGLHGEHLWLACVTEPAGVAVGSAVVSDYDFAAETAEELTVAPGDQLEVTEVLDSWLRVRACDAACVCKR